MWVEGSREAREEGGEFPVEAGATGAPAAGPSQGESSGAVFDKHLIESTVIGGHDVTFIVNAKRIQGVASQALSQQMTSVEAEAFLLLYHEQIAEALSRAVRKLVIGKLEMPL